MIYHTFQTSISHNLNYKANAFWNLTHNTKTLIRQRGKHLKIGQDEDTGENSAIFFLCFLQSVKWQLIFFTSFYWILKRSESALKLLADLQLRIFSPLPTVDFHMKNSLILDYYCHYFATLISINATFISTTLVWFRCIH